MYKATMKNNTDYKSGVEFTSVAKVRKFIESYYEGEAGDAYWESWNVEGDYPETIFDFLSPSETGDGWQRA